MWDKITNILSFTGISDKTVWQGIFWSSIFIPPMILLFKNIFEWLSLKRPSRLVFRDYISENSNIFIFHSLMSSADNNFNKLDNPKFIAIYPDPTPTDHTRKEIQKRQNIDPVCSVANTECVADVLNILGSVKKTKNIFLADFIQNWQVWSEPIFSVGFNPKTDKLIEKCDPIHFERIGTSLKMKNAGIIFDSVVPNDAGIIQKTFNKESKNPVFILAGLGTTGTSAAGLILKNNFVKIGKLFGNDPFCVFFKVKIDEGKNSTLIQKITPKPKWFKIILCPILYFSFRKKGYFNYEN